MGTVRVRDPYDQAFIRGADDWAETQVLDAARPCRTCAKDAGCRREGGPHHEKRGMKRATTVLLVTAPAA